MCNQLGFGDAVRAYPMSHFGSARSVPIWLDEVRCTVRDMMLSECRRNVWGGSDCSHSEDAGVICSGRGMIYLLQIKIHLILPYAELGSLLKKCN